MTNNGEPGVVSYKPFFALDGKYLVDPQTSAQAMKHDVGILMETSKAIVQKLIDDDVGNRCENGLLFALLHQLDMVDNLVNAMEISA